MKFAPKRSAPKWTSNKMGNAKKSHNKMGRAKKTYFQNWRLWVTLQLFL